MATKYAVQASAHIDAPPARVYGLVADYLHGVVTEPAPGRVLVETYDEPAPSRTTFTVAPGRSGGTDVTFDSEMTSRDGLGGAIERFVSTWFLKKLYAKELQNLAARAAGPSPKN